MSFIKQFFIFLVVIIAISIIDCMYLNTGTIGIDDGNIFLNYAHHLANGDGFVFNTNGEKVEGFTSLLWVLICAGAYLLTAQPEFLLICFSLLLTAFTITIIYRAVHKNLQTIHKQFAEKYFFWIYTAFIISIAPSYITWSVLSLMENALWNFIFTALALLVSATTQPANISARRKAIIVIAAFFLSLTRPEALAWNLVFACILIWTSIQNKRRIYFPVIYFMCFAIVTAGLTIFRLHYFGFQFPNTYYAKISPDKFYNITEGLKYALSFLTGYQPVISFLFILMGVFVLYALVKLKILKSKSNSINREDFTVLKRSCIIAILIFIGFFLPATTGGDHFGGFRFYQGLLPLFAFGILLFRWMFAFYKVNPQHVKFMFLSVVVLFLFVIGANDMIDLKNPAKTQLNFEFILAKEGRDLGERFNDMFTDNKPSTGIIAVGGFGLKYQGNTVDLMGLNNILMGHSPGDRKGIKNHAAFNKDVFYKLYPDIILPSTISNFKEAIIQYSGLLNENNFDNQAMKNIFNDSSFQKLYAPVYISDKKNNTNIFAFVNSNFINLNKNNTGIYIERIQPVADEPPNLK